LHGGLKIKAETQVKQNESCFHGSFDLCHPCDLASCYSEEASSLRMSTMRTERHKLTVRNKTDLSAACFLTLTLAFSRKRHTFNFLLNLSDLVQEATVAIALGNEAGFLHFKSVSCGWKNKILVLGVLVLVFVVVV
jgi:hypothetical protein